MAWIESIRKSVKKHSFHHQTHHTVILSNQVIKFAKKALWTRKQKHDLYTQGDRLTIPDLPSLNQRSLSLSLDDPESNGDDEMVIRWQICTAAGKAASDGGWFWFVSETPKAPMSPTHKFRNDSNEAVHYTGRLGRHLGKSGGSSLCEFGTQGARDARCTPIDCLAFTVRGPLTSCWRGRTIFCITVMESAGL